MTINCLIKWSNLIYWRRRWRALVFVLEMTKADLVIEQDSIFVDGERQIMYISLCQQRQRRIQFAFRRWRKETTKGTKRVVRQRRQRWRWPPKRKGKKTLGLGWSYSKLKNMRLGKKNHQFSKLREWNRIKVYICNIIC